MSEYAQNPTPLPVGVVVFGSTQKPPFPSITGGMPWGTPMKAPEYRTAEALERIEDLLRNINALLAEGVVPRLAAMQKHEVSVTAVALEDIVRSGKTAIKVATGRKGQPK